MYVVKVFLVCCFKKRNVDAFTLRGVLPTSLLMFGVPIAPRP